MQAQTRMRAFPELSTVKPQFTRDALEARLAKQDAAMTNLARECACLRAQYDLLEARLENGLQARSRFSGEHNGEPAVVKNGVGSAQREPAEELAGVAPNMSSGDEAALDPVMSQVDVAREIARKGDTRERAIGESIWESSILIGLRAVPCTATIIAVIVLLVNAVAQGLFCIIIAYAFTSPSIPENEQMEYWRAMAHEVGNKDPITGTSLVARVCQGDGSLQVAGSQSETVENLEAYLSPMPLLTLNSGPILFSLAWVLWAFTALTDAAAALELLEAVIEIQRGPSELAISEGGVTIASMSCGRVIFMGFLTVFRCAICLSLFVCGSLWLANEVNIKDLILNAAALSFVMDMDTLLYATVMPCSITSLVGMLDPLEVNSRVRRVPCLKDVGLEPPMILLSIAGMFVYLYTQIISENVDLLNTLNTTLCDGEQNFVWYKDEPRNILITKLSPEFQEHVSDFDPIQQTKINAAIQRWKNPDMDYGSRSQAALSWQVGSALFNKFETLSMKGFTYDPSLGNADCNSTHYNYTLEGEPRFLLKGVFELAGLDYETQPKSKRGCKDLVHACSFANASIIRAICPTQCGCDNPKSGLYLSGSANGCPQTRCAKSYTALVTLALVDCIDGEDRVDFYGNKGFVGDTKKGWETFWDQFVSYDNQSGQTFQFIDPGTNHKLDASSVKSVALEYGCAGLYSSKLVMAFCSVTDSVGALNTFCPVTCGCRRNPEKMGCPTSCKNEVRQYQAALAGLPCEDFQGGQSWTAPYEEWKYWAGHRFDKWLAATEMSIELGVGFTDFIDGWVRAHGCDGLPILLDWPQWLVSANFCTAQAGAFNLYTLCPVMCNCKRTMSEYCPGACAATHD